MADYDLLIVGSGLFGSVFAREALDRGKKVLVVDRRDHIGGNCYTECVDDINIHRYGAHIFRTDDRWVWDYIGRFCSFNGFINSPLANYNGKLYNLPLNMNTFYGLWGTATPAEAQMKIESQRIPCSTPQNLEEHMLDLVGNDIYETFIRGYTEKQWGRSCSRLSPSIMRRIPLRLTFDNNYFNARYQGIPIGGYTPVIEALLRGAEVRLGVDYLENKEELSQKAEMIVFTGAIDEYYGYRFGPLEYRSLRFEEESLPIENYQGVAVMNFTDAVTPYTRIIEHKHFEFGVQDHTIISREYPISWKMGMEPYYPIEDETNRNLYRKYLNLAQEDGKVRFGGRLGEYRYYDMQDTIKSACEKANAWLR